MVNDLTILDARPDWLTCSGRKESYGYELRSIAQANIEREAERGNEVLDFHLKGGRGYQCGGWRYVERRADVVCIVSGPGADTWLRPIAYYSDNWSRVDYAVTCRLSGDYQSPVKGTWAELNREPEANRLVRNAELFLKLDGGEGVGIGSRRSAYYGRIYAKWLESPDLYEEGSFRWEVELKRGAAKHELSRHRGEPLSPTFYQSYVADRMAKWGIGVPFRSEDSVEYGVTRRAKPDAERKLEWLASKVSPSIAFLVGQGRSADAIVALGLSANKTLRSV